VKKYKVAYATGSRADYGIVRNYLKKLNNDERVDLYLLVTGAHLEDRYGNSKKNIIADGFKISFEAKLDIDNNTTAGILHAMAIALSKFGDFFSNNNYDLLIILGDRYEMMSVAIAAAMQRIPILHLHGGETTFGNYDEFIRHSISKMSTFHFASTPDYRNRLIQLGENPDRVFYMGALGAENCRKINRDNVDSIIQELPKKKYFVVIFHPETLTEVNIENQINTILSVVCDYLNKYHFIFIGTNADTGSNLIRNKWISFSKHNKNVIYIENLKVDSYLYMVKNAIALIGNSSSGIIEAPSLETFTINIGDRQGGRVHGNSVVDIKCKEIELRAALEFVISKHNDMNNFYNPYYLPNTAQKYYEKTMNLLAEKNHSPKKFFDIINKYKSKKQE